MAPENFFRELMSVRLKTRQINKKKKTAKNKQANIFSRHTREFKCQLDMPPDILRNIVQIITASKVRDI